MYYENKKKELYDLICTNLKLLRHVLNPTDMIWLWRVGKHLKGKKYIQSPRVFQIRLWVSAQITELHCCLLLSSNLFPLPYHVPALADLEISRNIIQSHKKDPVCYGLRAILVFREEDLTQIITVICFIHCSQLVTHHCSKTKTAWLI